MVAHNYESTTVRSKNTFKTAFNDVFDVDSEKDGLSLEEVNALFAQAEYQDTIKVPVRPAARIANFSSCKPFEFSPATYKTNTQSLGIGIWDECRGTSERHSRAVPIKSVEFPDFAGSTKRYKSQSKFHKSRQAKSRRTVYWSYTLQGSETLDAQDFRQRDEIKIEVTSFAYSLAPKAAMTMMGTLNCLLYHAAESFGALRWSKGEGDKRRLTGVNKKQLRELIDAAKGGRMTMVTAVEHICQYLQRYWQKLTKGSAPRVRPDGTTEPVEGDVLENGEYAVSAPASRHSVRRRADEMALELDLFRFDSTFIPGARGQSRTWTYMNIEKMLLLAEALERRLGIDALPMHGAAVIRAMHEAAFLGWGYNRDGDTDAQEPETAEETKEWREYSEWGRRIGRKQLFQGAVEELRKLIVQPDKPKDGDDSLLSMCKRNIRGMVERWPWVKELAGWEYISRDIV